MAARDALFLAAGLLAGGWYSRRISRTTSPASSGCIVCRGPVTRRQRAILTDVGAGLTTKEIAARNGISEATVRTHVRRARAALGAPNRASAIAELARHDAS